eukprot:Ihof_evm3s337 gene=Ihof_evmTU3s337
MVQSTIIENDHLSPTLGENNGVKRRRSTSPTIITSLASQPRLNNMMKNKEVGINSVRIDSHESNFIDGINELRRKIVEIGEVESEGREVGEREDEFICRPRSRCGSMSSSGTREKKYTCSYEGCFKVFTRPCRLEEHQFTHRNERPFPCEYPDCHHTFTRKCHLQRHMRQHTGDRRYKCTVEGCEAAYVVSHHLKRHLRQHNKTLPFKCEECNQGFSKHSLLRAHEYQHTGVMPYICLHPGCQASLMSRAKLERHMKSHNREYKCDKEGCTANFTRWSDLIGHRNMVHGHSCPTCQKTFHRPAGLQEHMKIHTANREIFTCTAEGCKKKYTTASGLSTHFSVNHEGAGRFVCEEENCGRQFAHRQSLINHYDKVHTQ